MREQQDLAERSRRLDHALLAATGPTADGRGAGRQDASAERKCSDGHIAVGLQSCPSQQDTPYLSVRPEYHSWPSAPAGARSASEFSTG